MQNLKSVLLIGGLSAVVASASLTGCARWKEKEAKESGRTVTQMENDEAITSQVKKSLDTAPMYKYPNVSVSAYMGTVQLGGFVGNEEQKKSAAQIAQSVPGTRRVINEITVHPEITPTGRVEGAPPQPAPGTSHEATEPK